MALVLPILLVVLFAMVILGITINSKIAVSMAAREAARYSAVHYGGAGADAQTRQIAEDRLRGSITANAVEFAKSFNRNTDVLISSDGQYVTVTVTYHQSTMVPNLLRLIGGPGWGGSFALTSSATFKQE
jgi:Flp pilus assembly protein TadG